MAKVIVTPQARRDVDEAFSALYSYDESSAEVYVVAMHDGRSATSAAAIQR